MAEDYEYSSSTSSGPLGLMGGETSASDAPLSSSSSDVLLGSTVTATVAPNAAALTRARLRPLSTVAEQGLPQSLRTRGSSVPSRARSLSATAAGAHRNARTPERAPRVTEERADPRTPKQRRTDTASVGTPSRGASPAPTIPTRQVQGPAVEDPLDASFEVWAAVDGQAVEGPLQPSVSVEGAMEEDLVASAMAEFEGREASREAEEVTATPEAERPLPNAFPTRLESDSWSGIYPAQGWLDTSAEGGTPATAAVVPPTQTNGPKVEVITAITETSGHEERVVEEEVTATPKSTPARVVHIPMYVPIKNHREQLIEQVDRDVRSIVPAEMMEVCQSQFRRLSDDELLTLVSESNALARSLVQWIIRSVENRPDPNTTQLLLSLREQLNAKELSIKELLREGGDERIKINSLEEQIKTLTEERDKGKEGGK